MLEDTNSLDGAHMQDTHNEIASGSPYPYLVPIEEIAMLNRL